MPVKSDPRFKLRLGTQGLFTLSPTQFELVYMRKLKKIIRRRYTKAAINFRRRKFWIFISPNRILSGKSTNSRMGAGVGGFIRINADIKSRVSFAEFQNYNRRWPTQVYKATKYRIPFKFIAFARIVRFYNDWSK